MQMPPDIGLEFWFAAVGDFLCFPFASVPFIKRTLMKQPMPRSHLAAATATSRNWLRLAPRSIRIRLHINFRSPDGTVSHHFKFGAFGRPVLPVL